jgi:RNA polymerase sigma-B factor
MWYQGPHAMESQLAQRSGGAERSATVRLLRAYHERGDSSARDRLVQLYLPLVDSLVRRHAHAADDYDDLFQVGCIGLINAIDRFDVRRGEELAAFAVPNIAGEIRRHMRDRSTTVRLPRRVLELRGPAAAAEAELAAKLGRTPTPAEVARALGEQEEDVALALDSARASSAVELEPGAEPDDASADGADDRLFLAEAFRGLDERERRIVFLRYVRDMAPAEVARDLGLSERQLSRTTRAALAKLRSGLEGAPVAEPPDSRTPSGRLPDPRSKPKMTGMATPPAVAADSDADHGYHIELTRRAEPGDGWTARVEELPGCEANGATPDDAVRGVEAATERWIAEAVSNRREVPKPRSAASHSGRLMLRMPQTLHADLARAAQREDVSLNQFINGVLAGAVEWRSEGAHEVPATERSAGWTRAALLANIVVLAVVGIVALILLIVALG